MKKVCYRRSVLKTGSLFLATVITGCAGTSKSSNADCTTSASSENNSEVIQLATVKPNGQKATLRVLLLKNVATESKAYRFTVFEDEKKKYERTIDGQREHEFTIGTRPIEGSYRIVTYGRDGDVTDELEIEYQCNDG